MQLEKWRRAQRMTYARLGELIGVRTEGARRLCLPHGAAWRNNPTIPQLVRIMEITGGAVQALDFLPQNGASPPVASGGAGLLASDARPAAPLRGSAGRPLAVTSAAGRKAAATRKRRKVAMGVGA